MKKNLCILIIFFILLGNSFARGKSVDYIYEQISELQLIKSTLSFLSDEKIRTGNDRTTLLKIRKAELEKNIEDEHRRIRKKVKSSFSLFDSFRPNQSSLQEIDYDRYLIEYFSSSEDEAVKASYLGLKDNAKRKVVHLLSELEDLDFLSSELSLEDLERLHSLISHPLASSHLKHAVKSLKEIVLEDLRLKINFWKSVETPITTPHFFKVDNGAKLMLELFAMESTGVILHKLRPNPVNGIDIKKLTLVGRVLSRVSYNQKLQLQLLVRSILESSLMKLPYESLEYIISSLHHFELSSHDVEQVMSELQKIANAYLLLFQNRDQTINLVKLSRPEKEVLESLKLEVLELLSNYSSTKEFQESCLDSYRKIEARKKLLNIDD